MKMDFLINLLNNIANALIVYHFMARLLRMQDPAAFRMKINCKHAPVVSHICQILLPNFTKVQAAITQNRNFCVDFMLPGRTLSAMEVSIPIAFVLPGREHECNESFKLGRSSALS
ncbi:hypothetical protein Tco_1298424 [Tanacetum coccineum]